jgi:hypothetical protein
MAPYVAWERPSGAAPGVGPGAACATGGRSGSRVSLSHLVMPPKSLRQGRTLRTPAMAIGLTDHGWSSRESRWLPGHAAPALPRQLDDRLGPRLTPALQDQPRGRKQAAGLPVEVREMREDEVGTMRQAA